MAYIINQNCIINEQRSYKKVGFTPQKIELANKSSQPLKNVLTELSTATETRISRNP